MSHLLTWFAVALVFIITSGQGSHQIVERGTETNISSPVPSGVKNITWMLLKGQTATPLSTCILADRKCTNLTSSYEGFLPQTGSINVVSLQVKNATINETQFFYVPDTGANSSVNELEIYVLPTKLICLKLETNKYYDFECNVSNVYPDADFSIHLLQTPLDPKYIDPQHTNYSRGVYGSGTVGEYFASQTFRVNIGGFLAVNSFYVEVYPRVSNASMFTNTYRRPIYMNISLQAAEAKLFICPGESEKSSKTENSTCICTLKYIGFPSSSPHWYTENNVEVGEKDPNNGASVLTYSYNSSAEKQLSYYCRPEMPFQGTVKDVKFAPYYSSAMPLSINTGLQAVILTLGVALSGIVSRNA